MPLPNGKFLAFSREKTKEKLGSISGKRKDAPRPPFQGRGTSLNNRNDASLWNSRGTLLFAEHFLPYQFIWKFIENGSKSYMPSLQMGMRLSFKDLPKTTWLVSERIMLKIWFPDTTSWFFSLYWWFLVQWWDNCLDLMEADNDWASQRTRH